MGPRSPVGAKRTFLAVRLRNSPLNLFNHPTSDPLLSGLLACGGGSGEIVFRMELAQPAPMTALAVAHGVAYTGDAAGNLTAWDLDRRRHLASYVGHQYGLGGLTVLTLGGGVW